MLSPHLKRKKNKSEETQTKLFIQSHCTLWCSPELLVYPATLPCSFHIPSLGTSDLLHLDDAIKQIGPGYYGQQLEDHSTPSREGQAEESLAEETL